MDKSKARSRVAKELADGRSELVGLLQAPSGATTNRCDSPRTPSKVPPTTCECCDAAVPTSELQVCPFDADINNDSTPRCTCCDECRQECANDI